MPMPRRNEFTTVAAGTVCRQGDPKIAGMDMGGTLDGACPS